MASIPTTACDMCIAPPALQSKVFRDALLLTAILNSHWLKKSELNLGWVCWKGRNWAELTLLPTWIHSKMVPVPYNDFLVLSASECSLSTEMHTTGTQKYHQVNTSRFILKKRELGVEKHLSFLSFEGTILRGLLQSSKGITVGFSAMFSQPILKKDTILIAFLFTLSHIFIIIRYSSKSPEF